MTLKKLLSKHFFIVLFGLGVMYFTGIGQTFFFAQFNPFIMDSLSLSRTDLSFVYSLATFLASFNLTMIGSFLDKMKLQHFFWLVVLFIAIGFTTLSFATGTVTMFFAFYLIRGFGQAPLGMMATTTATRFFGKHRGKLLTLIGPGRSLSEGTLPLLSLSLIGLWGWQNALLSILAFFLISATIMSIFLIPKVPTEPLYPEKDTNTAEFKNASEVTWKQIFKEKWPVLAMLCNAIIPFVATGLFFQQDSIAAYKEWNLQVFASAFTFFSIGHFSTGLLTGPLIDRYTATKILPYGLIPFLLGLLILNFFDFEFAAYLYLGCFGVSVAMTSMVRQAFFAENFALKRLGKIKGMDSNVMVVGTSLAPIFYAKLIDFNVQVSEILYLLMGLVTLGFMGYFFISRHYLLKLK